MQVQLHVLFECIVMNNVVFYRQATKAFRVCTYVFCAHPVVVIVIHHIVLVVVPYPESPQCNRQRTMLEPLFTQSCGCSHA